LPPLDPAGFFQSPGIRHYASVAPSLAGGSLPSLEGLDWLKEKGYRTLIDLRKPSEVEPNFADAVNDRNMVYISLPIVANRLDASRLARFDDLIAQADHLPVYFCDSDGTRSGLVWYIHLRVVRQEDSQSASGKAEEIGLTSAEVKLGEAFLATYKPRAKVTTPRVALAATTEPVQAKSDPVPPPPAPKAPEAMAARPALPVGSAPATNSGVTQGNPPASAEAAPPMLPGENRPQASSLPASGTDRLRDPLVWRPIAALVLTGLGVPLAYWSRSAITFSKATRTRASLPGAVQSPSETPGRSEA
jgi:protein tyrosine phosphatase (PTP) superfamily phosphohydrolase (DUF442 family)